LSAKGDPLKEILMTCKAFSRCAVAMSLTFGLSSLGACGGDDTSATPSNGGAAGAGGTGGVIIDAAIGERGGTAGAGGAGESGGRVVDGANAPSDAASEEAAPYLAQTVFDFVSLDAGGTALGWLPVPALAGSILRIVDDDQAPTSPTAGALELRGFFPPPDANGQSSTSLEVNFGDPTTGVRDFTGASTFHLWVRIVSPASLLGAFQPFVQGGAPSGYAGTYQPFISTFDDTWHEYQIPVGGNFYLNGVWKLGIQFFAPAAPMSIDASDGDSNVEGDGRVAEASADGSDARDAGGAIVADGDSNVDAATDGPSDAEVSSAADAARSPPIVVHIDYIWVD
jgi:hypothetical protein